MKNLGCVLVTSLVMLALTGCSGSDAPTADPPDAGSTTLQQSANPFAGSREEWQAALRKNERSVADSLKAIDPSLEDRDDELLKVCGWIKDGINGSDLVDKVSRMFEVPAGQRRSRGEPKSDRLSDQDSSEVIRSSLQFVCPM